jgi:hypothetical protein
MRRAALAVAVVLGVGFAGNAPVGAVTTAVTTMTVTPSTDLVPGQIVHVSGTGFAPNLTIAAAECEAGAVAIANCDTGSAVFPVTDANGAYAFDFAVRRSIFLAAGGTTVDCTAAAGACVIGVADTADVPGTGVSAPISFAPLPPPQRGEITVARDRVDVGSAADVTATGFAAYSTLDTAVCAAGATGDGACAGSQPVSADATGGAEFQLYPPSALVTNDGNSIDCTVDDACAYAVWDARDFATTVATAPVRVSPIVPGTLSVTPSTGLHDGDRVQLAGSGWPGNRSIVFFECDTPAQSPTGHCMNLATALTDTGGTFGTNYTVHTTGDSPAHVDCETGPCWIYALYFADGGPVIASQPISFDVTTTPVTSHYTADELAAVTQAATTLGLSNEELQHLGSWALAWVLGITQTGTITPVPDAGPDTITTDWLPSEYAAMNALAIAHGTTLAEFQKTAALFVAYILSIS